MKISDLFYLKQGNSFELYNMSQSVNSEVNFVSRTAQNNGVVATVDALAEMSPFPEGFITVALGGSVLSSFVQRKPFYTAFHIMVLEPKREMTFKEKLYYCMCIQNNAYRYSYGRQANKTLKDIEVPDVLPDWVASAKINPITTNISANNYEFNTNTWIEFNLQDLFEIETGKGYPNEDARPFLGSIPFVTAAKDNNSIEFLTSLPATHKGNCITINKDGNGGAGYAFYQSEDFCTNKHVLVATPKFRLSRYIGMFIVTLLDLDKFRYNHGRAYSLDIAQIATIKLPAKVDGTPDYDYMENYIMSLPHSDRI